MFALTIVAVVMISTGICHYLARSKGLSSQFWIVMGALFGPFAIPFAYLAKDRATDRNSAPK